MTRPLNRPMVTLIGGHTLAIVPLLLLIRPPSSRETPDIDAHAAMD